MWLLTKKRNPSSEEFVAQFNTMPTERDLIEYISSITTVAILIDRGTSDFDGVEWLLIEILI